MNRISVVGSTGSGKSHLASMIARVLDMPKLELDCVFHQPNWTPLPTDEFCARVTEFAAQDRWVIDGNYRSSGVLDIVWKYADTVVWLDPSRCMVMWQVTTRSLSRAAFGTELWNGNRERWRNLFSIDPEDNIVLWTWTRFDRRREIYRQRTSDPQWSDLRFVRLCSRKQQRTFINQLRR